MSLFAELKRRNVFRVAAAYLVSTWLLIEIGSLMFDAFEFPDWASQLLITFLALGLIPTLIFAWAFELTPGGIKRESEVDRSGSTRQHTGRRLDQVTIAMILLALGVVMLQQFVLDDSGEKLAPGSLASPGAATTPAPTDRIASSPAADSYSPDPNSVAVLPFVNMSPDPDNEYFSDGISEELINLLVRIDGLRVPSRTSSFAFKDQANDVRDIARSLEVAHILEGSVRRDGQRVRVTAQLIDAREEGGHHLWSQSYDRELTDIFAIQDEIAGAIIDALEVALGTATPRPARTRDLEAYDLYLQGLHLFRQREQKLLEAERLLRQAVAADPDFAEAWATLALVYTVQPYYLEDVSRELAEPLAREAAARALTLDPTLPEPRAATSLILQWSGRLVEAMELSSQLIADHPQHALSRVWHGVLLLKSGYLREALVQFEAGYDLDPVSGVAIDWLARARMMNGETDEALVLARRAVQLDRFSALDTVAQDLLPRGEFDAFQREIPDDPAPARADYRLVIRALENRDEIPQILAALGDGKQQQYLTGQIRFFLGQPEPYFSALRSILSWDETETMQLWWPAARPFRQHPEMKSLARDFGLLALWRQRGWPDLCRPLGPEDFECD